MPSSETRWPHSDSTSFHDDSGSDSGTDFWTSKEEWLIPTATGAGGLMLGILTTGLICCLLQRRSQRRGFVPLRNRENVGVWDH